MTFHARERSAIRRSLQGFVFLLLIAWTPSCRENEMGIAPPPPSPAKVGPPAPEEAIDWLRQNAVPLQTVDPAGDDSDLAKLTDLTRGARVVALGEATHGTREFFRLKHRLLRHLVEKQEFRVFAMEADGAESCDLDAYIQGGEGDAAQEIRDLKFWTWQTEEFLGTIEWMRSFNKRVRPHQAIRFRGIDMQNPAALSRRVLTFLEKADPAAARQAERAYGCLGPLEDRETLSERYRNGEIDDQIRCASALEDTYQRLLENRSRYEPAAPAAYECALWSSRLMISAEDLLRNPSTRDRHYADNVLSLLDSAEKNRKVAVWAHNGHIANVSGAMGRRLKKQLAEEYLIVGLTFHSGSFRARPRSPEGSVPPGPPAVISAPPPPSDSYERAFHQTGLPLFVLDLRPARAGAPIPPWLAGPHPLRDVGGSYSPAHSASPTSLLEEYDLMIFLDRTEASRPLSKSPQKPG